MGGGLMQLVAYGAQDIYLTGNPQITFFKVVYRRHTNFSMECIEQTFNGTANFGRDLSATISRNGDLVHRMYLEHTVDVSGAAGTGHIQLVERYGDALIKECEIEIGGQTIDKHTSMWNRVYSDLTEKNTSGHFSENTDSTGTTLIGGTLYQRMTGNHPGFTTDIASGGPSTVLDVGSPSGSSINGFTYVGSTSDADTITGKIFLPLNFWFNRNPGLALPLIALQYHEVKVKMTIEQRTSLIRTISDTNQEASSFTTGSTSGCDFKLWADYIYLDTDERRRFAQVSHEYLIEQLQSFETTITSQSASVNLNFNHPVKELIWCTRNEGVPNNSNTDSTRCGSSDQTGVLLDPSAGPVSLDEMGGTWQILLNGHDRFSERTTKYFTRTQVWQHHSGFGAVSTRGTTDFGSDDLQQTGDESVGSDSIAVYSFALKPEEHQPSGTCNFSRIDNAKLVGSGLEIAVGIGTASETQLREVGYNFVAPSTTSSNMKITIFAVNYNVLRIMSGMGGLAYSN